MPRHTRRRTQRADAPLEAERPVRLQTQRRFFTSSGNDSAVREARAIADAFQIGTEFLGDEFTRRNTAGARRAADDVASGRGRNEDDTNAGYMKAWDQLDAERDLNLAKKELPEILRGADWENLKEDQVQEVINKYAQENFEGADGFYKESLAPGLLELETNLIAEHRDMVVARVQTEQLSTINSNLQARFESTGEFDYKYAMEQTATFLDGADKKVAFWEMVRDVAVENGDPSILDNVPERFPSGDPTGVNDPRMQTDLRSWRREALGVQANMAAAEQEAIEAEEGQNIFNAQLALVDAIRNGRDGHAEMEHLRSLPGVDLSAISTARNFASSYRDDSNEVAAELPTVAGLWADIQEFSGSNPRGMQQRIWTALADGQLGNGRAGIDLYNEMQNKLRSVAGDAEREDSKAVTTWRSALNKQYAADKGGLMGSIDPVILRINLAAHNFYTAQLSAGDDPEKAFYETTQRFDPILAAAPTLNEDEIDVARRRPQSDFEAEQIVTDTALKAVGTGEREFVDMFGGVNPAVIERRVSDAVANSTLNEDEATRILTFIYY